MFDPEKLREAREAKGLNPSQLAIKAGLARNVVHRLEDGSRGESVSAVTLARLAKVLDVTVDHFLNEDEPPAKVASVATHQEPDAPPATATLEGDPNPDAWRWG